MVSGDSDRSPRDEQPERQLKCWLCHLSDNLTCYCRTYLHLYNYNTELQRTAHPERQGTQSGSVAYLALAGTELKGHTTAHCLNFASKRKLIWMKAK